MLRNWNSMGCMHIRTRVQQILRQDESSEKHHQQRSDHLSVLPNYHRPKDRARLPAPYVAQWALFTLHGTDRLLLRQIRSHMPVLRYVSLFLLGLLTVCSFAEWTPYNLGTSGNRSITTFNGAIYVATYNVGIQKSTTNGASWVPANTGLPVSGTQIKVQSIGHSDNALLCGTESGIYRSTDNGASWTLANSTLTASATIYANKFYSFLGATFAVFSGTVGQSSGGVFRTFDNGDSWLQGFNGLSSNMTVYNIDQVGTDLYASTSTALMKSTDLGQSWTQAGTTNYAVYAVQGNGSRIVALTTFGARYTLNGGDTWTNSTNYPVANPTAGSELIAYDSKYYAITKSGSTGCYRSLDGGATWEAFNTGLSAQNTFAQEEFHASGNTLYIACALDIYSTPGTTTDIGASETDVLPAPYPTLFSDRFTVDLSTCPTGSTLVLIDATGREALRLANLPATPVRVERSQLVAGRYHCMLIDPTTGAMRRFGSVIAQ